MTNYVTEAVASISKKQLIVGAAVAGVLACGSVGAVNALSVTNTGNQMGHTQSQTMTNADGKLWVDGGLQGSSTAVQGENASGSMQKTATAGEVNGAVAVDAGAMVASQTQSNDTSEWGSGSRSSESNGSVNAGAGVNVTAEGTSQTSHESGVNNSNTSTSQSGSLGLGLDLGLGVSGSSMSSTDDGLLNGGLLNL